MSFIPSVCARRALDCGIQLCDSVIPKTKSQRTYQRGSIMRKLFLIALALLFVPLFAEPQPASARSFQDNQNSNARSTELRHADRRRHRRHRRGIGQSYKQAGISTARGGAGFGKNVARRKPIKAGKVLGTNMKDAGQNVGEGSK